MSLAALRGIQRGQAVPRRDPVELGTVAEQVFGGGLLAAVAGGPERRR
jgi:hypothetical protein